MESASLLDKFSQAGPLNQGTAPLLPDTGAVRPKKKKRDPLVGIVADLNRDRDLNITHDFDYWIARDSELLDDSAFAGIQKKIMANRFRFNNFSGNPRIDFTNISEAERQYYSDFLGINFKKIGHAIGSVGKSIGHAAAWAGNEVGHGANFLVKGAEHGALSVAHEARHVALNVAHGARDHIEKDLKMQRDRLEKQVKDTGNFLKKDWRYVADAAVIAGSIVLAATGVGIPLAAALLTGGLSAINSIPYPTPQLPAGFGSGGGMSEGEGAGFPDGMADNSQDDDGLDDPQDDTGQGLTFRDQARLQQEAADAQEQQAAADEAKARKRKMIIGGVIIAGVIIAYWLFKKK
jgi:hypothetical protein